MKIQHHILNILRILAGCFVMGILFKIMHWPGAKLILSSVLILLPIVYSIRFYFKDKKLFSDYLKLVLVIIGSFAYLLHKILHWPFGKELYILTLALLCVFLLFQVYRYLFKNETEQSPIWNTKTAFSIPGVIVFIGVLFKIMHWPGASILLIVGLAGFALLFTKDLFNQKEDNSDSKS